MEHPLNHVIQKYMRGEYTKADVKRAITKYKKVMELMRQNKVEW